jgi:hypothetical protein
LRTAAATITSKLVTNAFGVMTGATVNGLPNGDPVTMLTGFDPLSIATSLGGAVAGYFGSTLAGHVMVPQYQEGARGQQVARRRQAKRMQRGAARMKRPFSERSGPRTARAAA